MDFGGISGKRIVHSRVYSFSDGAKTKASGGRSVKIVLSRKGFDSSSGGHPSPILPGGEMLSLPIPVSWDRLSYHGICAPGGKTYGQIIEELDAGAKIGSKGAHLDPDLVPGALPRLPDWLPAFGQIEGPATHLRNHEISVGDLFLFFGWFRPTEEVHGKIRFRGDDNGFHAIFGYLQIGEIVVADEAARLPSWLTNHPHVAAVRRVRKHNTIYVATPKLSFDPHHPGAGVFQFDDWKVLTKEGESRSRWNLNPEIFRHVKISYHSENSWKTGYFQSAGRGQEFVIHADERVIEWAFRLIKDARLWQH